MIGAKAKSVAVKLSNAQYLNFNFSPPHTTAEQNAPILHIREQAVNRNVGVL